MRATVGDAVATLDERYPQSWAQDWDAVGLAVGDLDAAVERVLFAVDPTDAVVEQAISGGCQLIVTHHPLLFTPVHGVAATDPKGRLVSRLLREGVALFTAHTNADAADPGVSDSLAAVLGVHDAEALDPLPPGDGVKLVTFVPSDALDAVIDALTDAGAGTIGNYTRCAWTTPGEGTFVASAGADPAVGRHGEVARVAEHRVEMVVPASAVARVVSALRAAHPYEEPAFDVYPLL